MEISPMAFVSHHHLCSPNFVRPPTHRGPTHDAGFTTHRLHFQGAAILWRKEYVTKVKRQEPIKAQKSTQEEVSMGDFVSE